MDLAMILLLISPSAFLLSVWMGVCGCGCPSSLSVLRMGTNVLAFKNNAPSSASADDDITFWMIVDRLRTAQLFGGIFFSLDRKWWPFHAIVHYFRKCKMHLNGLPVLNQ